MKNSTCGCWNASPRFIAAVKAALQRDPDGAADVLVELLQRDAADHNQSSITLGGETFSASIFIDPDQPERYSE